MKQLAKGSQDPNIVKEVYGTSRSIAVMRLTFLIGFLLLASFALGQAGGVFQGSTAIAGNGNVLRTVPHAQIVVCGYPSTGSSPCTNTVTTYTTPGIVTACPLNAPVLIPGTTTCSGTSDAAGNFSFIVAVGQNIAYYFKYLTTWYGPYVTSIGIGGSSANFASPPPLGNVAPNTVGATTVTVNGDGLFFQPQSNCIFEGSDPTLHEVEDVSGKLMWLYQGLGGPCTQILTYTPLPDGITPADKQVIAYDVASGAWTVQNQTTNLPTAAAQGQVLAATGAGTTYAAQTKLTLDARDIISGLDCTGVTNHGPVLSTLTDNVSGTATTLNGNRLVFPAGCTVNVGSGWMIRNLSAFEISGPATAGSTAINTPVFKYTGTAGGTAISMDHVNSFRVSGIAVDGNKLADIGISVDEASGCGGCLTTYVGSFVGVNVSDSNSGTTTRTGWNGISISPTSPNDVSDIKVIDSGFYCHASSTTSAALKIGNSFNAKNEIFQHNNLSSACAYGIWALNGNFVARENNFSNNQVASIRVDQASDDILVERNSEEADPQFFVAGSAPVVPVTFLSNHIAPGSALNAAVYQVDTGNLNPVIFMGNSFTADSNITKVLGSGVGGGAGPSLTAFGNKWPNATFSAPWASPSSGNVVSGSWVQGPTPATRYLSDSLILLDTSGLGGDNMVSPSLNLIGRNGNRSATTSYGLQAIPNGGTNTSANSTLALTQQGFTNGYFATNLNFSGLKLAAVTAPVWQNVSTRGTAGSTSYTYAIVAHDGSGTVASATQTIVTGNATLNGTNFNVAAFFSTAGAAYYDIYRTASSGTPSSTGKIGSVFMPLPTANGSTQADNITFSDTGLAGDSSTLPVGNTTGVIDASLSPFIFLPISAGYVATAQGNIGYDTTNKNWHVWQNATDRLMAVINGAVTNNDCAKFVVSGSTVSLQDAGACAGGTTTNALTANNSNSGAASGTTFDGSVARTISTNTIGAPNLGTANTFGAFLQDFSASTIKLPVAAGFTTTANGNMGYDSTNLNWHIWQNGADRIAGVINGATTNGDCSKFVVSGSTVSLQDSGAGCGPVSVSQMWLPWGTPNELPISPTVQTGQGINTVGCIQFVPADGITATKMSVSVNTTSASTFNVGIYDNSLNLVRDSGSFACGTGGGLALSNTVSSFTLTPGATYYACVAFTDATCAIQGLTPTLGYSNIANKNATRNFTCANALSAGAMPGSCGGQTPVAGKEYIILLEQ